MRIRTLFLPLVLVLAAFLSAPLVRANDANDESDTSGQIRVDVVVDMTEAGHKIVHPTADKPAYYLPLSVGYKEFGYAHHFIGAPTLPLGRVIVGAPEVKDYPANASGGR